MDPRDRLKKAPRKPTGVTAEGPDGRIYFLPDADAKKFEIPASNAYRAFRYLHANPPVRHAAHARKGYCKAVLKWLLSNNPDSEHWRQISVDWMNNC